MRWRGGTMANQPFVPYSGVLWSGATPSVLCSTPMRIAGREWTERITHHYLYTSPVWRDDHV